MKLQTAVPLSPAPDSIGYHSKVLLIGSCFAEHIGAKLEYYQFPNSINPLGIFFHPAAIEGFFDRLLGERPFIAKDVFEHDEQWHSFEAHSRLSQTSQEGLLKVLNDQLLEARGTLKNASHVFITLGSAWGYQLRETGKWVANCHKVPQQAFSKQLWDIDALQVCLANILDMMGGINPGAKVVFSVSPVRHLKDGFLENQRSKAHLIAAVHKLVDSGRAVYFPAYELMVDELRDYRFYAADLVHPNELAVDYIWEKFVQTWVDKAAHEDMREVEAIRKGLAHRPHNRESKRHQKFLQSLQIRIDRLHERYPFMSF